MKSTFFFVAATILSLASASPLDKRDIDLGPDPDSSGLEDNQIPFATTHPPPLPRVDGSFPDNSLTPGAYQTRILSPGPCDSGWSTAHRSVSTTLRHQAFARYGITSTTSYCNNPSGCELDHLVPLELGGANNIENLFPMTFDTSKPCNARDKDRLENTLHKLVCSAAVDIVTAQLAIAQDWVGAYEKYIGDGVCTSAMIGH